MSPMSKALVLTAALAAGAAQAQPAARPDVPPGPPAGAGQPGARGPQNCPAVNGQAMINGAAMGAHMRNGRMVDRDGKVIMGGMMGRNGVMCVPQAGAGAEAGKAAPKADK